jgi:copper ion binding protein
MPESLKLHVTGMTCGGCENAVHLTLTQLRGVREVTASHKQNSVNVTYDTGQVTAEKIKQAIEDLGYHVAA